jgi:cytochrome c oxidase subunit 1
MTTITTEPAVARTYLNHQTTVASWLLTKDHKRIGILYLLLVTFAFMLGGIFAAAIRIELTTPQGEFVSPDLYNRLFTMHGIMMVFFVLIPAVPAILGNFVLPLMIGAKDVAFPRINLLSWYVFAVGMVVTIAAMVVGGVDTGWTFYTPYSSTYSSSNVFMTGIGVFITGFSSILTGLNFMVTIHRMRAPGMTWFRLPLLVWALYATSLVQILATPVIAITVLMLAVERAFGFGIFDPRLGGDPVLFQHLFWFYSHPAVYIMILPPMGVISEVIPSAVKTFNWTATLYKGAIWMRVPMMYVFGFLGLFLIGGLTGLFLASLGLDIHMHDTYFVVAHFHYIMVGGAIMGYFAGLHYWWPKMTGRMFSNGYPDEFQVRNVLSSAGASILAVGYILPLFYFMYSLKFGALAGDNPWGATGLEWKTQSPPLPENFLETPIVNEGAYEYSKREIKVA